MKSFQAKQQVPDHVRDRILNNNGKSLGSCPNVRVYSQQRPHYLLPKKIISKFNPPKQHQQQQQRYHYPPSSPSKLNAGISSSLSCYVCKKSFPSSQFLYSHMMRLHPERGLKGVLLPRQAPMTKSVIPSQSLSSNERGMKGVLLPQQAPMMKSVIPSQSLSSNERGMKGALPPQQAPMMKSVIPSQSLSSNERGMKGALPPQQAPMMKSVIPSQSLSSNERGMKGALPPQQAPMMKAVIPSQSLSSNERGMKVVLQPRAPISPIKSVVPSRFGSSSASELSDVKEPDCDPVKLLLSWGKKDRRGRTNNPCPCACNAAIASLQKPNETTEATKSSSSIPSSTRNTTTRNALIANQQNPKPSSSTSTTDNEISLIDNKMMKMTMMTKKHKCSICHKEFDTGQALGGHKSSSACKAVRETKLIVSAAHEDAPQVVVSTTKKTMDDIEEGEIIEDGEITDEEGSQRISHKMFDFDLNELPPEE